MPRADLPPDLRKLWVDQTISAFGSHFTTTGLPLGAIAGAALAGSYGIRTAMLIGVAGSMASGAAVLFSPVRRITTLPE